MREDNSEKIIDKFTQGAAKAENLDHELLAFHERQINELARRVAYLETIVSSLVEGRPHSARYQLDEARQKLERNLFQGDDNE